ncbi:hypothetical protein BpHYR1_011994 [Brachionus plicatilis]|uniref:Uncharacterized protein n=1 Tax=Brachionus plicatilis TaxID=10195 RepID=A0A3M7RUB9_BRAPC|nr:hypothetical protein BpHYR1_011994 [Brachionus plicatilis]
MTQSCPNISLISVIFTCISLVLNFEKNGYLNDHKLRKLKIKIRIGCLLSAEKKKHASFNYDSPLGSRYASKEMLELLSSFKRIRT